MKRDPHATMFLERFQGLYLRLRKVRLGTTACWAALALLASVALLAAADYLWELGWGVRRALLASTTAGIGVLFVRLVWLTSRRWSRPATAAELEQAFPVLGQRVRTTLQFAPETPSAVSAKGVAPTLVQALAHDTDLKTQPLELDVVVPSRRFTVAAAVTMLISAGLILSVAIDGQWRTAVRRAVLANVPYTTLEVEPGNASVVEGGHLNVRLALEGRTQRRVTIQSRPRGDSHSPWSEESLDAAAPDSPLAKRREFETRFARITEPMEYRVVIQTLRGRTVAESPTYHIDVRYPLAIQSIETTVTPPSYTGLSAKTYQDGSITALRRSRAVFRVTLDRAPATASMQLARRDGATDPSLALETIAVKQDGAVLYAELPLDSDFDWSVVAASSDGTPLPENTFRVRVHDDRPPQITFTEPADSLEVHTLAEIVMQTRVTDDYGVSRTGIVFQINSDEEHTLVEEDFAEAMAAVDEVTRTGQVTPRTRAVLERILPLEHFALTQKDCVVYYAFAEDNFPGTPNRSETDLRFIDIRPFKTIYRVDDSEENQGSGDQGRRIASLEELIRRQRYALNRSIRLQKIPDRWADSELNTIDRLIDYQTDLAQGTRELAQFLESRGSDVADVLFQAEAAMLGAVDSLSIGRYDTAVLQEKDAQQRLVEARDKLEIAIRRDRGLAAALRAVDQRLAQKIRRTRSEEDERRRERVVQRLIQLAMNEASVAQSLAGMPASGTQANSSGTATTNPNDSKTTSGKAGESNQNPDARPDANRDADTQARAGETPKPTPDEQKKEDAVEPPPASGSSVAQSSPEDPAAKGTSSIEELQDKQAEIAVEAADLMNILQTMEDVTELAKERMKAASESANTASADLNRQEIPAAQAGTRAAAEQLREVARQVAALLAGETSQQVAGARDIAAELTYRERQLANDLEADSSGGGAGPRPQSPSKSVPWAGLTDATPREESQRLLETTKTLHDIMKAIADSKDSTSAEAVDRVAELLGRGELKKTVERFEQLPSMVADSKQVKQAQIDVRDAADRMEATARELDRLYRSIVTPRIEQLRELEQRAVQLQQQLAQLPSMAEAREWERGAGELLESLEQDGIGGSARDEIKELLAGGGGGDLAGHRAARWGGVTNGFLVPPRKYVSSFQLLVETIQQHIQEILLSDLRAAGDEATPPAYRALVERYMQVLAKEARAQ